MKIQEALQFVPSIHRFALEKDFSDAKSQGKAQNSCVLFRKIDANITD